MIWKCPQCALTLPMKSQEWPVNCRCGHRSETGHDSAPLTAQERRFWARKGWGTWLSVQLARVGITSARWRWAVNTAFPKFVADCGCDSRAAKLDTIGKKAQSWWAKRVWMLQRFGKRAKHAIKTPEPRRLRERSCEVRRPRPKKPTPLEQIRHSLEQLGEPPEFHGRGIVTSAGSEKYNQCAYVLFKLLRHVGCELPIECWYLGEAERDERFQELCEPLGVTFVDAIDRGFTTLDVPGIAFEHDGNGIWNTYKGNSLNGYAMSAFAILNSSFREVLWLDPDNSPVRDPTFLFESAGYLQHGAIFWPDVRERRLMPKSWEVVGLTPIDEREIESGQLIVDKSRCWQAINAAWLLNERREYWYRFMWGDKETYHLGWRMVGADYQTMPDVAWAENQPVQKIGSQAIFVQHDDAGEPLFFHRVMNSKYQVGGANREAGYPHHAVAIEALAELQKLHTTSCKRLSISGWEEAKEIGLESGRHVVTVAIDSPWSGHSHYKISDDENCLRDQMYQAIVDATAALRAGPVHVHCMAGISRSVSVATAAVALVDDVSFDEAFRRVKSIRPQANPHSFVFSVAKSVYFELAKVPSMKLLILQTLDGGFSEIAKLCIPSVAAYAERHGYDHLVFTGSYGREGLHGVWHKMQIVRRLLADYDCIWALDVDVIINDPSLRIDELIDRTKPVNICHDGFGVEPWHVNAGSIVWSDKPGVRPLLDRIIATGIETGGNNPGREQSVLQELLHVQPVSDLFAFHPASLFNHDGRLLTHFCGTQDPAEKLQQIKDRAAWPVTKMLTAAGSDKTTTHKYGQLYDRWLAPLRHRAKSILEIGVLEGCSLRAWREYFPNAIVHGIDKEPRIASDERIVVHPGDGTNPADLSKVIPWGPFDLVVDDADHTLPSQRRSFELLRNFVAPGGLYVIEDLNSPEAIEWCQRSGFEVHDLRETTGRFDDVIAIHKNKF